jgi:hypothetical protein
MQEKSVVLSGYTRKCNCHFKKITEGCMFGYELPGHCQLYYVVSTVSLIVTIISTCMKIHIVKDVTISTIFPGNKLFFLAMNEVLHGQFSQ